MKPGATEGAQHQHPDLQVALPSAPTRSPAHWAPFQSPPALDGEPWSQPSRALPTGHAWLPSLLTRSGLFPQELLGKPSPTWQQLPCQGDFLQQHAEASLMSPREPCNENLETKERLPFHMALPPLRKMPCFSEQCSGF